MRVGVVQFPGTNCELDVMRVVEALGGDAEILFHSDPSIGTVDAVIVPGGFAHGDYLRAGAIARFSPIMAAIERHAADGKPLAGICNGFQILCEAGLLPGALVRNESLKYVSRPVDLRVERCDTPFTTGYRKGEVIRVPVGHGDGRYTASEELLDTLESEGRVVFRYVDTRMPDSSANPNGAIRDIAAISNREGNVVGMMPHPERLADTLLGSNAGTRVFSSLVRWKRPVAVHV